MMIIISGVYSITCIATGRSYVGSSVNIKRRYREHKLDLRRNKHPSKLMQEDYDQYGWEGFECKILNQSGLRLLAWEQHWMDKLECLSDGYNID